MSCFRLVVFNLGIGAFFNRYFSQIYVIIFYPYNFRIFFYIRWSDFLRDGFVVEGVGCGLLQTVLVEEAWIAVCVAVDVTKCVTNLVGVIVVFVTWMSLRCSSFFVIASGCNL